MSRFYPQNVEGHKTMVTDLNPKKHGDDSDPLQGSKRIPFHRIKKYLRSDAVDPVKASRFPKSRNKLENAAKKTIRSVVFSARSELLLPEESGYLEADQDESTYQIKQKEILDAVDITTATKHFDLKLNQLGPYRINYFRNGRQLLLSGQKGHVAALDWITKDLLCEFNIMESIHDVQWLHMPTLFAVAQKDWVHIYDNRGTEIHCLKKLYRVSRLDFLPYHFLLVAASETGYLSYLDVSYGKVVSSFRMPNCGGRTTGMVQNPSNAVMLTSHPNGTVAMWTPNDREAVVKMLCHPSCVQGLAVTSDGNYLATTAVDRGLKIWDLRNYKALQNYKLSSMPGDICFSQRDILSVSLGNVVELYNTCIHNTIEEPYMRHCVGHQVTNIEFSNFEDVLGIGHVNGFTSILVPGAGEPNFDAFEANPFMSKAQRKEMEVKSLLEKIQPELITLDSTDLGKVHEDQLRKDLEQKPLYVKPAQIEFKTKNKKAKKHKIVEGLKNELKRKEIQTSKKSSNDGKEIKNINVEKANVLDRFKPKKLIKN